MVEQVTNPNRALWEKGDFTRIAASMRDSGEALVDELGINSGLRVLDLGCGDGTTALAGGPAGADVLGVDIAANLVAAGNRARRRPRASTNCRFQAGRCLPTCAISLTTRSTSWSDLRRDVRPAAVRRRQGDGARHPARRADRDGQLDSGRPDPGGPDPQDRGRVLAAAPEGFVSPMTWGVENDVRRAVRGRPGSRPTGSPVTRQT